MKKILMLSLMAALVISVVTALAMLRPEQTDFALADTTDQQQQQNTPAFASAPMENTGSKTGLSDPSNQTAETTARLAAVLDEQIPDPDDAVADEVIDTLLSDLFAEVADAYQSAARYPHFSQPIADARTLQGYQSNGAHQVSLPFPLPNGDTYHARLRLDRYRYTPDDQQQVSLELSTDNGTAIRQVEAEITDLKGQTLYTQPLNLTASAQLSHDMAIDLTGIWQPDWPAELQWRVRARLGQQQLSVVAPFYLDPPVAILSGLGTVVVNDGFLEIPLNIQTDQPGYYFVQANLFSENGTPLLHLQTEGPVANGYPPPGLQAFGPALMEANAPGPYLLTDIQLTRLGDDDQPDRFGRASQTAFPIPAIPLDAFEEVVWEDPMLAERLEFLKGGQTDAP